MDHGEVILRFSKVTFGFKDKPILSEAEFSVRRNAKLTIMGQNGAGKSTIFKLITGALKPDRGEIFMPKDATIGIAMQMIPKDQLHLTVLEFFENAFSEKIYDIKKRIDNILNVVNLNVLLDKQVKDLSGGQKARLLLAFALIQNPDILLLDEPTNNLDKDGIAHLTEFLINYKKTCLVISHDANFLNSFTEGVLNLDVSTRKVEQFVGDYYDVVEQIGIQVEKARMQNARMQKSITTDYEKINFFKKKSAQMNKLAKKLEKKVEDAKENVVEVRREDKTIRNFTIEEQHVPRSLVEISSVTILKDHKPVTKKVSLTLRKNDRLLISGPNGIGKSTFLKALVGGEEQGCKIDPDVIVGYYSQDFSELDFEQTAFQTLFDVMEEKSMKDLYSTAAVFLFTSELLKNKIEYLSDGQKGLLCYARFVLQKPGLLILDEPSNHINFRHLPVIAKALDDYAGTIILVSHDEEFLSEIKVTEILDLGKI